MPEPILTLGRGLFFLGNLFYTVGSFAADWNETHIYNKNWPPHARFHNGQTMSLGVLLGLSSTYLAFRPVISRVPLSLAEKKHSVLMAAVVGSFYCAAGLSAILYPGSDWFDEEHRREMTQKPIFTLDVIVMWVAYAVEIRRLGKGKVA